MQVSAWISGLRIGGCGHRGWNAPFQEQLLLRYRLIVTPDPAEDLTVQGEPRSRPVRYTPLSAFCATKTTTAAARRTLTGMIDSDSIFIIFDLLGVFVGALTGALVARRLRYDITGLWGIALVSGLGGGIIRDICLQNGPHSRSSSPRISPPSLWQQ